MSSLAAHSDVLFRSLASASAPPPRKESRHREEEELRAKMQAMEVKRTAAGQAAAAARGVSLGRGVPPEPEPLGALPGHLAAPVPATPAPAKAAEAEAHEQEEEREEEEEQESLELPPDAVLFPLTPHESSSAEAALSGGNPNELLLSHDFTFMGSLELTRKHLQCLLPGGWLNDEVINYYLSLMQDRAGRKVPPGSPPTRAPRFHFFNTFFYNKLFADKRRYEYGGVRRWTLPKKTGGYCVLDCDVLLVPVHQGVHWVLAAITLIRGQERIEFLDSLGGLDPKVLDNLARWVKDEAADKQKREVDTDGWARGAGEAPVQRNGFDCGVFMLMMANYIARGRPLAGFTQAHMPLLRRRILADLMREMVHD